MLFGKGKPDFGKMRDSLIKLHQENWKAMRKSSLAPEKEEMPETISLDDRVDNFIKWVHQNIEAELFMFDEEGRESVEMRNFIEKMASWYELRYPDYELNRLMPWTTGENRDVDDIMFNKNSYINKVLDKESETRVLDWDSFYNAEAFIKSLPLKERCYFNAPRYSDIVYVNPRMGSAHLHLTPDGIVEESEYMGVYSLYEISDKSLIGMHVRQVVRLLKEKGIILPKDNELEQTIQNVDNWLQQKDELLNCVMYRLIERGGSIIGPRRALLFAKEFGKNIDIPMMYGVDFTDDGLRGFINEYIKAGGSPDLECYVGYFYRPTKNAQLDTMTVQRILEFVNYSMEEKYTPEETGLHQGLVNVLSSQIDPETLKKEEVREQRLQRKLAKSHRNK